MTSKNKTNASFHQTTDPITFQERVMQIKLHNPWTISDEVVANAPKCVGERCIAQMRIHEDKKRIHRVKILGKKSIRVYVLIVRLL
jgi:hypothetical protein